jgi:DNA-binding transcriptional LysR family regulator
MPAAYDRMPLGALRVFEAVATHLNFSAAAEALNVTPAAVSQQIKSLESYVQVPLFRRNGRRVEITEAGVELLPAVRAGLDTLFAASTRTSSCAFIPLRSSWILLAPPSTSAFASEVATIRICTLRSCSMIGSSRSARRSSSSSTA